MPKVLGYYADEDQKVHATSNPDQIEKVLTRTIRDAARKIKGTEGDVLNLMEAMRLQSIEKGIPIKESDNDDKGTETTFARK